MTTQAITITLTAQQVAAVVAAAGTPVIVPPPPPPPPPGIPKIAVQGKNFTWNGATVQLRGFNMSGMENTAIQGWNPGNPWADGGTPNWPVAQTWKPSVIRIPWNAASFLGIQTWDTVTVNGAAAFSPTARNADPGANYKATLKAAIDSVRGIGCIPILDLHWTAPTITLQGVTHPLTPAGQPSFIDANMGLSAWIGMVDWLTATYGAGGYPDVVFELINEPFLNSNSQALSAGSADAALLLGGTNTDVINSSQGGANFELKGVQWTMVGYQQLVNAMRSLGATNVILVGGNQWMQNVQNWKAWFPVDPLKQTAVAFHAYSDGAYPYANGDVYWKTTDPGTGTKTVQSYPEAILAAGVPVIITETSGHGGTGATSGEPFVATTLAWADANNVSVVGWQWNGTQAAGIVGTDNYLTMFAADDKTIVPITGTGVVFHDWMVNHK